MIQPRTCNTPSDFDAASAPADIPLTPQDHATLHTVIEVYRIAQPRPWVVWAHVAVGVLSVLGMVALVAWRW